MISYDFATNKLIYKASVPEDYVGRIFEVGLYTLDIDPAAAGFGSRILTTFDSATEEWVDPLDGSTPAVYGTANTRVGIDALLLNPAASATMSESQRNISMDLSGNSAADSMLFALNVANANTNAVNVRFMTDTANYYTYNLGTGVQTAGYKIIEMAKGAATVTGAPDWSNITELKVEAVSKASGASNIEFDAIRVEDRDTNNLDYVMVARKVLPTSMLKLDGQPQELEFTLDVTL